MPRISLIICTYNRSSILPRCLVAATRQTLAPEHYEVIVVDNASTDATRDIVSQVERVRYLYCASRGLSAARNTGVSAARSPVVGFLDDDAIAAPDLAGELLSVFEANPSAGCVGGRIRLCLPPELPGWYDARLAGYFSEFAPGFDEPRRVTMLADFPFGANVAFRKVSIEAAGYFSESLGRMGHNTGGGEELDLEYRLTQLGFEIWVNPRAHVDHVIFPERVVWGHIASSAQAAGRNWAYYELELFAERWSIRGDLRMLVGALARLRPDGDFRVPWSHCLFYGSKVLRKLRYRVTQTTPSLALQSAAHGATAGAKESGSRMLFIDNLRWTMIILVISMHAADTYSPLGNWYFTDRTPLSRPALIAFAAWQIYLQAFFMGLLFFIAGVFVPASLDRKGPAEFLRDRAFRLGLPVLFYMFILGPITEYFVAHSWTSTRPTSFVHEWIKHIRNGEFLQENGPLWFCLALLIFSVVYVAWRWLKPEAAIARSETTPGHRMLICFALVMAASTFLVRLMRPHSVFNLPVADFAQYVLMFGAGILAARKRWLPQLSYAAGMRWMAAILPAGFAAWLAILTLGGGFAEHRQAFGGGWHWQSAAMNLWESFTCVALSFGLLVFFREKFNAQGRLERFLSANAFGVYVFHPPIVILAAIMLHSLLWPSLVKFAVVTVVAAIVSFCLSAAVFRRIPLLRSIL